MLKYLGFRYLSRIAGMLMYKYHTGNISVVCVWVITLTDISNKEVSPELEVCNWSPAAYNQFQIKNGKIA